MECRAGETSKKWFRSSRIYCVDGKWFFTTREGDNMGPFVSRHQAEKEVVVFISSMKKDGLVAANFFSRERIRVGANQV